MDSEQIQQWAREVGICPMSELAYLRFANPNQLHEFATLVRNATLEEAAVKCDGLVDHAEYSRAIKLVSEAEKYGDLDDQLAQYKHAQNVNLFNCGIEKCAKQIRSLKT